MPAESHLLAGRPPETVLLVGRFGPPLLTFARSCGRSGVRPFLLEVAKKERSPHPSWLSRHLIGRATLPARLLGTPDGLSRIREIVEHVRADAIVAANDTQLLWLSENRKVFEPKCRVLAPEEDRLRFVLSKEAQLGLARAAGFDVLPTFIIQPNIDGIEIPTNAYPVCLRPATPQAAKPPFKVHLAANPQALTSWLSDLRSWCEPLLAQPFLDAPSTLVHGARSEKGELLALEGFAVDRKLDGLALTVRPEALPAQLGQACRAFVEAADISGVFHFDVLGPVADGRLFFLEINVRLGGTTDKVYRLGFDEPLLHLRSYGFAGRDRPPPKRTSRSVGNTRMLLKCLLRTARGALTPMDYPGGSRARRTWRSARDLLLVRDSVFDPDDLLASLRFHLRPPTP